MIREVLLERRTVFYISPRYSHGMGLDAIEIILRTEELFKIRIHDEEAAEVRTIGDFYKLVCSRLRLVPLTSPVTSAKLPVITQKEKQFWFMYKRTPLPLPSGVFPWSPQSVWDVLVVIFVDQMGFEPQEVLYNARIVQDLGIARKRR